MMRVGVISDTHGFLDSRIRTIFQRVDHILHAGDIGPTSLISQMETLAPVTAVTGNTDFPNLRQTCVGQNPHLYFCPGTEGCQAVRCKNITQVF